MSEEEDKARMAELDRIVRASPGAGGPSLSGGGQQGAQMNPEDSGSVKMRFPIVTVLLLVANVVTYLVDMGFGMNWLKPDTEVLVALGANYAPMTLTGESWRLVSSMFMHGSIEHIAVNMYMLIIIGLVVERSFGHLPYLAIYLASGVAGGLCSALWSGYHEVSTFQMIGGMIMRSSAINPVVSVGASGALMGIAGACLAARVVEHLTVALPDHVLEGTGKSIAQVIGINLVFGFVAPNVDQAAHIGGLLAGAAVGGPLFMFGRASVMRGAMLAVVAGVVALAGGAAAADRAGSEELRDVRAQFEQQAREQAEAEAKQRRRAEIEKMAADDLQKMPPPVSAQVAAGTEIDLHGEAASAFALGPGGRRLYVAFEEDNVVKVVDLERRVLERVIKGPPVAPDPSSGCRHNMCRGVGASGIAISGDERFAYVTSLVEDALSIVDLTTDQVVASIPVGRFPRRVMLSADGRLAFVMNSVDNSYSMVDLAARSAIAPPFELPGGSAESEPFGRPLSVWMSADGNTANFFDSIGNVVASADARIRTPLPAKAIGEIQPGQVLPLDDGSWLLFAADGLASYDVKTGTSRVEFVNCSRTSMARVVALSADKKMLALSESGGLVRLVKLATGKTMGLYPVPSPGLLAFSNDGRFIYALSWEGMLSIVDVAKSIDVAQTVAERGERFCMPDA